MGQRLVALATAIVILTSATTAAGQSAAPLSPREQDLADHRQARDEWRAAHQAQAAASCGARARYDDEGLHLGIGTHPIFLRDHIDIYQDNGPILGEPTVHILLRCLDAQGLYVVRLVHWEWAKVGLFPFDGAIGRHVFLHGEPEASPDGTALVFANEELGLGPRSTIQIVRRDDHGHWRTMWDYRPPDAAEWHFAGWEGPSRFRLTFWNGMKNGEGVVHLPTVLRWESVIEFSAATFTRTDGPKTPDKPYP